MENVNNPGPGPDEQAAAKDNANEMAKQRKRFIGKSDC